MEFFDPHADPRPGFVKAPSAEILMVDSHGHRIFGRYLTPALYSADERRPVVILCHGMPGPELNLDLAEALRRFSCEIEHNDEHLEAVLAALWQQAGLAPQTAQGLSEM